MTNLAVRPQLPLADTSTDAVAPHTPGVRSQGKRRNVPIQWLRGIAALLVMLYHGAVYQQIMFGDGRLLALFGPPLGFAGVSIFFAISGYLMSIAMRVQKPTLFLAHRAVRIYPLYLLAVAILCLLTEALGHPIQFDAMMLPLMPLAGIKGAILGVEWTLVFEISFYVCLFAIAFAKRAHWIVAIALGWLAALAVCSILWPYREAAILCPLYSILFVSSCVPMAGGLMIPALAKRRVPFPLLLAAGLALCGAYPWLHASDDHCRWLFGASAVLIVWGAVAFSESARFFHLGRLGRMLETYGDYSYALYLCHVPIIYVIYAMVGRPGLLPLTGAAGLFAATVTLCIVCSVLLGWMDVRLYRRSKDWLGRLPGRVVGCAALAYFIVFVALSAQSSVKLYWHDKWLATARQIANEMLARAPIATPQQATTAALEAGYAPLPALAGRVDLVRWTPGTGQLYVDAWALDRRDKPVMTAFYRGGRLLTVEVPLSVRADVATAYGLHRANAVHFELTEPCDDDPVVAVAYTHDRHFLVLPSPPFSCARGAVEGTTPP